jgi:hypothetical protein
MLGAGLKEGQQIEELPDLNELAPAGLAHQNDRQIELCTWSWFLSRRRWPLIGNDSRMHILPAEFRCLGIGEGVCGIDDHSSARDALNLAVGVVCSAKHLMLAKFIELV